MNTRCYFSIVLATVGWLFFESNGFAQGQRRASELDHEAPQLSINASPPGFATRWDYLKSFTTEKDATNAYQRRSSDKMAMGP
jgi:hypothetical protein